MSKSRGDRGFRTFLVVWFGQVVSLLGSGLTGFALGVWVYQRTGSATQFSLISLFTTLPGIILSPIAGALVDRWDRRHAMILSDTGAGLCTLIVALLLTAGKLQVWHIYLTMAASSAFSAFQWPAYSAATTMLVSKEQLGRAGGMTQLGEAIAQISAPVLAGLLVGLVRVQGVILIDFATFGFALLTLLFVRVPRPAGSVEGSEAKGKLLQEAAFGWRYIVARPGLLGLLLLFAGTNFVNGIVQVLFTPLVLSFTTAAVLGTILSVGGLGMLAGSVAMSAWGGPKVRVHGILLFVLFQGLALFAAAFPPRAAILAGAAACYFFGHPIINGCSQAIWQTKTPPDLQGRVFAVRHMIAWSSLPLAYVLAGPLADYVFEPLLDVGGGLAGSLGRVIGTGPGRGIAALYLLLGVALLAITAGGYVNPRLRRVETELPDVVVSAREK